jgi:hypothetical protein
MPNNSILLSSEVIDKPVRYEGQEEVPFAQLRTEPWYIVSGDIPIEVGGATLEEALDQIEQYISELANTPLDVYVQSRSTRSGTSYEGVLRYVTTLNRGDRASHIKVGEVPSKESAAHPLSNHFTPGRRPSRGQRHTRRSR